MLVIIRYRCEKCKREFDDKKDAEACENKHLIIKETIIKNYGIHTHPYEIEIIFNNGDSIIYVAEYLQG